MVATEATEATEAMEATGATVMAVIIHRTTGEVTTGRIMEATTNRTTSHIMEAMAAIGKAVSTQQR